MNLIVAVDRNWAIGNKNKLLNSIPEDMKFFRTTTTGKVVIMGRKTLESFPGGQPLKKRLNIVISKNPDYHVKDAVVVPNIQAALDAAKDYDTRDVYVIGGESIYRQMLPYCDVAHVTKMDYAYEADTWFPNLDQDEEWEMVAQSEEKTYFDLEYEFDLYVRKTSYDRMKDYIREHCMD
ncbi:MAG TPA: dihydrofolate reductase [Candidatus Scybalocola faecavium]|nr:dihydrofolate reductase [Candidatus Scybalocola faecavium]